MDKITVEEVLKRLRAMDYQDSDELRDGSEKEYGLDYTEALEMAYDNIRDDVHHLIGVIEKRI